MSAKQAIGRVIGPEWRRRLRRTSRLRWVTKAGILRRYGVRPAEQPVRWLSYVLWDPEVESHSYHIYNEGELVAFVSDLLGVPAARVAAHVDETKDDPELHERLEERTRWRFDVKTKLPVANRLLWYAIARSLKPRLIVETGIYEGLGSLVLLRALERNAAEGAEGELWSVDIDEEAGWLVPPRLRDRWRVLVGYSTEVLAPALEGREVGMLIQDSPHTYENQSFEFSVAYEHRADRLVLIDSGGGQTPALQELCDRAGVPRHHFRERARDHWWVGRGSGVAVFERGR